MDSESGTDASDDEDADATVSGNSSDSSDEEQKAGDITYLDLTKAEVEVISNPDEDEQCKAILGRAWHLNNSNVYYFSTEVPPPAGRHPTLVPRRLKS